MGEEKTLDAFNITVVGAGIVGREFLKILDERKVPVGHGRRDGSSIFATSV
jgi:hypothetical protein